jgi:hypothetical protein
MVSPHQEITRPCPTGVICREGNSGGPIGPISGSRVGAFDKTLVASLDQSQPIS